MSAPARTCPHCGKELASDIPVDWMAVPKVTWLKLCHCAQIRLPDGQEVARMTFTLSRLIAICEDFKRLGEDAHYWIDQMQKVLNSDERSAPLEDEG